MCIIIMIIIIIRPSVANEVLRNKNIEHRDRGQMQSLPPI
jgi:hypothetical protein